MLAALWMLQTSLAFDASAPNGTGLEWLTLSAVVLPAVVLVVLVYLGAENTV